MASRQQRRDRLIFLVPSMTVLAVILFYPLAYSLGLKHHVILDVFIDATGFVLRAVAGVEL